MSIVRRDAVLFDLIDLAYYIALDNVEAAYRFLDQVEESFRDLERMVIARNLAPNATGNEVLVRCV